MSDAAHLQLVRWLLGSSGLGEDELRRIEGHISERVAMVLSESPARRAALTEWLIDRTGLDAPDDADLLREAALEGLERLVIGDQWDQPRAQQARNDLVAALSPLDRLPSPAQ